MNKRIIFWALFLLFGCKGILSNGRVLNPRCATTLIVLGIANGLKTPKLMLLFFFRMSTDIAMDVRSARLRAYGYDVSVSASSNDKERSTFTQPLTA